MVCNISHIFIYIYVPCPTSSMSGSSCIRLVWEALCEWICRSTCTFLLVSPLSFVILYIWNINSQWNSWRCIQFPFITFLGVSSCLNLKWSCYHRNLLYNGYTCILHLYEKEAIHSKILLLKQSETKSKFWLYSNTFHIIYWIAFQVENVQSYAELQLLWLPNIG